MKHNNRTAHDQSRRHTKTNKIFVEQARKACKQAGGACEIDGILIGDARYYVLTLKEK